MVSPDTWLIALYFLAILLIVYLFESLIVALLTNLVLRTPLNRHLLSSLAIGTLIFFIAEGLILFLPGQFVTYNSEPRNFRTWLVYNQLKVNAIAVLIGLAAWQIFVRNRGRGALESK